jgi:hypothetical protein
VHKYLTADTYRATVIVQDNQGGLGFANATSDIVVPTYAFTGFGSPVDNLPVVNLIHAGQAVPLKFSLGGNQGLDILNTGTTNPAIQPYNWKTSRSLTDCQRLSLTLDDGTVHQLNFQFK